MSVSYPLQTGIRFFRNLSPADHQIALQLTYLRFSGDLPGFHVSHHIHSESLRSIVYLGGFVSVYGHVIKPYQLPRALLGPGLSACLAVLAVTVLIRMFT